MFSSDWKRATRYVIRASVVESVILQAFFGAPSAHGQKVTMIFLLPSPFSTSLLRAPLARTQSAARETIKRFRMKRTRTSGFSRDVKYLPRLVLMAPPPSSRHPPLPLSPSPHRPFRNTCLFFFLFFLFRLTLGIRRERGILRYFYGRFTRRCHRELYRGKFLRGTG